jgi:hypothetical protein
MTSVEYKSRVILLHPALFCLVHGRLDGLHGGCEHSDDKIRDA